MEIGENKVIDQREQSSMGGGCWQEFLVLGKLSDREFQLDIRGWDCLGEIGELGFEEDEHGEFIVPDEINGKNIGEIQDGFVYGGELMRCVNEGEVNFTRPEQDEVIRWLKDVMWHDEDVIKTLAEECTPYSTQG